MHICINRFLHEYSCKSSATMNIYINKLLCKNIEERNSSVGSDIYFHKQS